MPFSVAELDDRPACRALAQPLCAEPIVYKLPLQHSRLQCEQCVPEPHAGKERSLTSQIETRKSPGGAPFSTIDKPSASGRSFLSESLRRDRRLLRSAKLFELQADGYGVWLQDQCCWQSSEQLWNMLIKPTNE